jgi:hypothetical protein
MFRRFSGCASVHFRGVTGMASVTNPLTTQDFARFLEAKRIDPSCPECKSSDVGYEDETAADSRFADLKFAFPDWAMDSVAAVDKVMLICQECGYTRSYNRDIVLRVLGS